MLQQSEQSSLGHLLDRDPQATTRVIQRTEEFVHQWVSAQKMLGQGLGGEISRGHGSESGFVGTTLTDGHFRNNRLSIGATSVKHESLTKPLALITASVTPTLHPQDTYPVRFCLVSALLE